MELLWQNGQVVMQSQTQMSTKKSPLSKYDDSMIPLDQSMAREVRSSQDQQHLFMQEDEMASWLHFEQDFSPDLLYPSTACVTCTTANNNSAPLVRSIHNQEARPQPTVSAATASRPPIPPTRKPEAFQNFAYFSRHRAKGGVSEAGPSSFKTSVRESTVVDSSETPAVGSDSRISEAAVARSTAAVSSADNGFGTMSGTAEAGPSSCPRGVNNRDMMTYEMTVTSSPGGSSSAEPPSQKPPTEDRKRKGREEDMEDRSEDVEFESPDAKKKKSTDLHLQKDLVLQKFTISQKEDDETG